MSGLPSRADLAHRSYDLFVDGAWTPGAGTDRFDVLDPYDHSRWADVVEATVADVDAAVQSARTAFESWRYETPARRAALLRAAAAGLESRADELALVQVRENGKLWREMRPGIDAIVAHCYYAAGLAEQVHGETLPVSAPQTLAYTLREPLGVVAAITPWNSPLNLLVWKLFPALATGNTVVVKPSEISPVSTLLLAEVLHEAGFPAGVVNVVTGGATAGRALVEHPGVDKIAFTGSTAAGRAIAASAGERLTRVSLELGGKSPNIVFADAHLPDAVNGILGGIYGAGGQTCIAGSRVLLQDEVYDEVAAAIVARATTITMGDPLDPATEMGPVACQPQYDRVVAHLRTARDDGAEFLAGGPPETDDSLFVAPTVIGDLSPELRIGREEVFGPVVCLFRFRDEDEAVRIANDTEFGLGAGIWTQNLGRAHRLAARIRAGTVWVNNYRKVSYTAPFGGFKQSGIGRENGLDVIHEFTEVKTVWVDTGNAISDPFNPFA